MSETTVKKPGAVIAEGSEQMAAAISSMVRGAGYFVAAEVHNDKDLVAALARRGFGLMVVDDNLPGQDSIELVRQLRADATNANRTVPIIMTSTAPDVQRIKAARDAGVTEFLRKPFSAADLQSRLAIIESKPRAFIDSQGYAGPDRRRRTLETDQRQRQSDLEG